MTLRNFLLAWHIATRQNPRMAVALEQAIRGKDDLAPFQEELKKRLTDQYSQQLIAAKHVPFMTYVDAAYPPRLREIPQPPLVLFLSWAVRSVESINVRDCWFAACNRLFSNGAGAVIAATIVNGDCKWTSSRS